MIHRKSINDFICMNPYGFDGGVEMATLKLTKIADRTRSRSVAVIYGSLPPGKLIFRLSFYNKMKIFIRYEIITSSTF